MAGAPSFSSESSTGWRVWGRTGSALGVSNALAQPSPLRRQWERGEDRPSPPHLSRLPPPRGEGQQELLRCRARRRQGDRPPPLRPSPHPSAIADRDGAARPNAAAAPAQGRTPQRTRQTTTSPAIRPLVSDTTTILQWNADGVRSKRVELEKFIHDLKPDIVVLQETKLTSKDLFQIRGYHTLRTDRRRGRRADTTAGGGVATHGKGRHAIHRLRPESDSGRG